MYLVGSAEYHGIIQGRRMHDTFTRSGYVSVGGRGTLLPEIHHSDLRGDFLIYSGRERRRDMFAVNDVVNNQSLVLTCRGGLAGIDSTLDLRDKRMIRLLETLKDDKNFGKFYEPLSRFF
jgi:hypothetical protein